MPSVRLDAAFVKQARKILRRHPDERDRVRDALDRLAENPRHKGLVTKRYAGTERTWQSRIDGDWRMWWRWDDDEPDTIVVEAFGPHPN